jgi:tetratricopeptide (TPR) repeat protein/predicted Ser/Thr protein kinase
LADGRPPGDEPTLEYSEQNETVDLLGAKARAARGRPEPQAIADPVTVAIGRYRLLELVGAGGMGMVWGAWDPELERRVALKLVRRVDKDSRERMLREGQVLARLSHPNVVPIFDVGEVGDQVYLVMEWVRGTTLREFARGTPAKRELLAAFRQAGAALAAAHEVGVVHRDFKPDNAIRGEDGRVRVLDFGIAHDVASGESADKAGTPRYMAPEQASGAVTAASDQFAFCVSLRESFGTLPSWIEAIVVRGTDPDPAKRFESMPALLDALDRDPARKWRRAAVGVVVAGAAAGAFAIGQSRATAVEACTGASSEIAAAWNPTVRARMIGHLRALGEIGDADAVGRELEAYSTAWIDTHTRACRAHERKEVTQPLYETRLGCLNRTRAQLGATAELMSTVSAAELPQALLAARSLPDVRRCAEITTTVVPPPAHVVEQVKQATAKVERALVLATAKSADALTEAEAATTLARTTGYEPLIARALLVEGRAKIVERSRDGRPQFAEAMTRGLRASDDVLAVEAYARWVFEHAVRTGSAKIDGWDAMSAVAERLGDEGRFARALMYNNRAVALITDNKKSEARTMLAHALAIAGDLPDLELLAIQLNLTQLETDPMRYERGLRDMHDRLQRVLGPDHPDVLVWRIPLALVTRDRARARESMENTCRSLERWRQLDLARECTYEAALLSDDGDDREAAVALMTKVIEQSRATKSADFHRAIAESYISTVRATPELPHLISDLDDLIAKAANNEWTQLLVADALMVKEDWARAHEVLEKLDRPMYQRRLARARRMLAVSPKDRRPAEARELARFALDWYRDQPGDEAIVRSLEAIIAATESR